MKLVTVSVDLCHYVIIILIHTSVKLVTLALYELTAALCILIHTSVKLVTFCFCRARMLSTF